MATFFEIDDDDESEGFNSESVKNALTSEVDTIRSAMEVVNLYVSNFMGTAGAVLNNSKSQQKNQPDINS